MLATHARLRKNKNMTQEQFNEAMNGLPDEMRRFDKARKDIT